MSLLKVSPSHSLFLCLGATSSPPEEKPAPCRYLTELRNLTKGPCHLDQVEVSYCSGHCRSSTNVMTEVSQGLLKVQGADQPVLLGA